MRVNSLAHSTPLSRTEMVGDGVFKVLGADVQGAQDLWRQVEQDSGGRVRKESARENELSKILVSDRHMHVQSVSQSVCLSGLSVCLSVCL